MDPGSENSLTGNCIFQFQEGDFDFSLISPGQQNHCIHAPYLEIIFSFETGSDFLES